MSLAEFLGRVSCRAEDVLAIQSSPTKAEASRLSELRTLWDSDRLSDDDRFLIRWAIGEIEHLRTRVRILESEPPSWHIIEELKANVSVLEIKLKEARGK